MEEIIIHIIIVSQIVFLLLLFLLFQDKDDLNKMLLYLFKFGTFLFISYQNVKILKFIRT